MKIPDVSKCSILVIGDVMLDLFIKGSPTKLSPEAPVPVVLVTQENATLGGSGNVAANLAAMGVGNVEISGIIGDDYHGKQISELLERYNIKNSLIISKSCPTITKTRVIATDQHVVRYDREVFFENNGDKIRLKNALMQLSSKYDAVIVSDYSKGTISKNVIDVLKKQFPEAKFFGDAKPENHRWFKNFFCLTPNFLEAQTMTKKKNPTEMCRLLQKRLKLSCVTITLSENGLVFLDEDGQEHSIGAHVCKSLPERHHRIDVTGAGDTLLSVLCSMVACGVKNVDAVKLSNIAAGIVVNKLGTSVCTHSELQREINHGT